MNIKMLTKTAKVPTRGTCGAAGYDLYSDCFEFICSGETTVISTGVAVQIPKGHVGFIKPRSGLAFKHGIDTMAGVIDSDYRAEIKLLLTSHEMCEYQIDRGHRIAQLVILPVSTPGLIVVDEFDDVTDRGCEGFGSTGL